jgi:hypothetical protein
MAHVIMQKTNIMRRAIPTWPAPGNDTEHAAKN